ncbi:MAG: ASCH domain-containing protein [Bacilli bacterium]|nr:ASCH domain-containing protein [Bacilli bacterium]
MKNILISIKKEFVDKIISGEKKYEFRTRVAQSDVNKLIIYCTLPTKKVVAEAEIIGVIEMPKEDMWNQTRKFAGISKEDFMKYFNKNIIAYAYELGKVTVYEQVKELNEYGVKHAPQSFVYV